MCGTGIRAMLGDPFAYASSVNLRATHGALPHRAPSTRCTAESNHAPCVAQVNLALLKEMLLGKEKGDLAKVEP